MYETEIMINKAIIRDHKAQKDFNENIIRQLTKKNENMIKMDIKEEEYLQQAADEVMYKQG